MKLNPDIFTTLMTVGIFGIISGFGAVIGYLVKGIMKKESGYVIINLCYYILQHNGNEIFWSWMPKPISSLSNACIYKVQPILSGVGVKVSPFLKVSFMVKVVHKAHNLVHGCGAYPKVT